jgi:hypothetical protein
VPQNSPQNQSNKTDQCKLKMDQSWQQPTISLASGRYKETSELLTDTCLQVNENYQILIKESNSSIESILRQFQDELFDKLNSEQLNKVIAKLLIEINKSPNHIKIESETINNIKDYLKNLPFLNDDIIMRVLCYDLNHIKWRGIDENFFLQSLWNLLQGDY